MAEKAYTTGQAALALGVSSYKVRALCEAGLIDAELTSTGRWKIPAAEIAQCQKHGLPEVPPPDAPDSDEAGEDDEPEQPALSAPRPAAAGIAAPPSKKLIASKEKVLRLENKVKEKDLERQIRRGERAEREEVQERGHLQRAARWRQESLDYALARLPKDGAFHTQVHADVEELLNRIRPEHPTTHTMIDAIVEKHLRPLRRREEQERAIKEAFSQLKFAAKRLNLEAEARLKASEAVKHLDNFEDMRAAARKVVADFNRLAEHHHRVEDYVNSLSLPFGRTAEEREDAEDLARAALKPLIGASESQFKSTAKAAIALIVAKIEAREARNAQERQQRAHANNIERIVGWIPLLLPQGATAEEKQTAQRLVRAALESLPSGTPDSVIDARKHEVLAPIESKIRARNDAEAQRDRAKFKAGLYLSHIERYLRDEYDYSDDWSELSRDRERLVPIISEVMIQEIIEDPKLDGDELRERIEELVEDNL